LTYLDFEHKRDYWRKQNAKPRSRAARKRYAATAKGKAATGRYIRSPEAKILRQQAILRWREANPEKYAAQRLLFNALRRGLIVREPCEICGALEVEAHHEDYSKPLQVRFLCRRHHREYHRTHFVL
jgi:hypothetical protein